MKAILGTMTFGDQVNRDTAAEMLRAFFEAEFDELDSAYVYQQGKTEALLGDLREECDLNKRHVATKVNPHAGSLSVQSIDKQFNTSLERMGLSKVDLLYLHEPDPNVPIIESLSALHQHHQAGRFKRFGLSNYPAWQVAEIAEICKSEGWMMPVVYQGMYNAVTRDVERELFLCLDYYDIAFYVYNPLAGGMLSGKHASIKDTPEQGRFAGNQQYLNRYWKHEYFEAIDGFVEACQVCDISPGAAALRWLVHHSDLKHTKGDGIVLGASSQTHLNKNLRAIKEEALPIEVVSALDRGWEIARPNCIKYFRP